MTFARASAVADAVLLEGYLLYPYRASALKNRYRWSFGVLAPRAWSAVSGTDPWWLEAQLLVEDGGTAPLSLRLRFLQLERRVVYEHTPAGARVVPSLEVDGRLYVTWDEGRTREVDLALPLADARAERVTLPFTVPAEKTREPITDSSGSLKAILHRRAAALNGVVHLTSAPLAADRPLSRVVVRVENHTPWDDLAAPRETAMGGALLSTHLLLASPDAPFISLMDPPSWAREHAEGCRNVGVYPVLMGSEGERGVVLASPIILYDHPRVAPESPGDFFDATEIDALLTLRTKTLTDDEKRQVRATDPRAAEVLARSDTLPPEWMERLYGAVRERTLLEDDAGPARAPPLVGARVRTRPSRRRTDAQDALFAGRAATVEKVEHDVDGRVFLALTFDDDPAAALHRELGRFHYYELDEVEPLPPEEGS